MKEEHVWFLVVLCIAGIIGAVIYVGHQGSVREDAIRVKCIEAGGNPVKPQSGETLCFRGMR